MIPLNKNYFFEGVVEDVDDPMRIGRVRVRIMGVHTDNKAILPTEMLPWATVGNSILSASISGVGFAPVGMVPGTMVYGIFRDEAFQEPFVMGTVGGFRQRYMNTDYGFNDPTGQYPIDGVDGDMNSLAGGIGYTGSTDILQNNSVNAAVSDEFDPTEAKPVLNEDEYKKNALWMPYALSSVGINEKDNPDVIQSYHEIGGGVMREATVSWCASFANWCLIKAGITGTRSASSRSFMTFGISVGKDNPPYGSIAVFGVPNSGTGHVAFVLSDKGDNLVVIGGNQSDSDNRSGGQVSKTTIPKNGSGLILLDCRLPTNLNNKT